MQGTTIKDDFVSKTKRHIIKKDFKSLEQLCNEKLEEHPDHCHALSIKRYLEYKKQDVKKSKSFFDEAKQFNQNKYFQYWYSKLLLLYLENKKAIEQLNTCIQKNENYLDAKVLLASIYVNQYQYSKALEILETESASENPIILNKKREVFFKQKEFRKAKLLFEEAISHDPQYIDAYINLGNLYCHQYKLEHAMKYYENVLVVNPNCTEAMLKKVNIFLKKLEFEKAENLLNRILDSHPKNVKAALTQVQMFVHKSKFTEGFNLLEKIKLENHLRCNEPIILYNEAGIHMTLNDTEKALELFQKSVNINKYEINSHIGIFRVYNNQQEFDKIEKVFSEIEKIFAEDIHKIVCAKAQFYSKKRCLKEAIELFEKALEIDPYIISSLRSLSMVYRYKKDFSKSRFYIEKSLEIYPQNILSLIQMSAIYRDSKQFHKSLEYSLKALKMDSFSIKTHINMGHHFNQINEYQEALKHFEKALSLQPKNLSALNATAACYYTSRRFEEAIKIFQNLIELDKYNVDYYSNLSISLFNQEKYEEALVYINTALSIEENDGRLKFRKGLILVKTEKMDQLRFLFSEMLEKAENTENDDKFNRLYGLKLQVIYLKHKGKLEQALDITGKILEIDKFDLSLWVDKLYIMNEINKSQEVLEYSHDLMQMFPKFDRILYQLGIAAMQVKDFHKAENFFFRVYGFEFE